MNIVEAKKLKIGDYVIAPKAGIFDPRAIDRIVTKESDPRAIGQLPLFGFEDSPNLYTYRFLMRVIIIQTHIRTKEVEELHLTRSLITEISTYNGLLDIVHAFKFLKEGKAIYTKFHKYETKI